MMFFERYTQDNTYQERVARIDLAFMSVVATNASVVIATTETVEYSPAAVKAILKAESAPPIAAPEGEQEFLDWLNEP